MCVCVYVARGPSQLLYAFRHFCFNWPRHWEDPSFKFYSGWVHQPHKPFPYQHLPFPILIVLNFFSYLMIVNVQQAVFL